MNQDHVKVLVSRRMEQATDCLEDGRFLLSAKRGARTVVNRAYYAAFYAVLALLQTTGRTPRKHKGVLALFDSEFVKPGLLSKNESQALHQLFNARLEDDYQRIDPVQPEEAAELIAVAEHFVQSVREYLTRTGYLQ
jgi:uncharacterized protein (UPF0332 family)